MDLIRIGAFEVYAGERRLCADGKPVEIGARAFDLLLVLAENPGRLVTKAALIERVWPRLVVDENNLPAQIAGLRRILGPAQSAPCRGSVTGWTCPFPAPSRRGPPAIAEPDDAAGPCRARRSRRARTPLVGRDSELGAVREALERERLVTLVGAAGVGKSRLAREILALEREPRWRRGPGPARAPGVGRPRAIGDLARARTFDAGSGDRFLGFGLHSSAGALLVVLDGAEHLAANWPRRWRHLSLPGAGAASSSRARRRWAAVGRRSTASARCRPRKRPAVHVARRPGRPALRNRAVNERLSRRSAAGWTAIRSPWNSRRHACRLSGWPRCWHDSTTASGSSSSGDRPGPATRRIAGGVRLELRPARSRGTARVRPARRVCRQFRARCRGARRRGWRLDLAGAIDIVGRLVDRSLVTVLPRSRLAIRCSKPRAAMRAAARSADGPRRGAPHGAIHAGLLDRADEDYWSADEALWLHQDVPDLDNVRAALDWARRNDGALPSRCTAPPGRCSSRPTCMRKPAPRTTRPSASSASAASGPDRAVLGGRRDLRFRAPVRPRPLRGGDRGRRPCHVGRPARPVLRAAPVLPQCIETSTKPAGPWRPRAASSSRRGPRGFWPRRDRRGAVLTSAADMPTRAPPTGARSITRWPQANARRFRRPSTSWSSTSRAARSRVRCSSPGRSPSACATPAGVGLATSRRRCCSAPSSLRATSMRPARPASSSTSSRNGST